MAGRKEYEMLFALNARMNGGFSGTFSKAQAEFSRLGREIQGLHKIQGDIASYQKQQGAIDATRAKLESLQKQHDLLQKEIGETSGSTAGLEREKVKLEQRIKDTETALERQNQKLEHTGAKLKEAGVDTKNLAQKDTELTARIKELGEITKFTAKEAGDAMGSVLQRQCANRQTNHRPGLRRRHQERGARLGDGGRRGSGGTVFRRRRGGAERPADRCPAGKAGARGLRPAGAGGTRRQYPAALEGGGHGIASRRKTPRIFRGVLSGELPDEGVLQHLGAVDPTLLRHSGHPGGERHVFPHRAGVGLRPVGNGIHADQCEDIRRAVGDVLLRGSRRNGEPLLLPDHQTAAQSVCNLFNGVFDIPASGGAAGNVGNADIAFLFIWSNYCGIGVAHKPIPP